MMLRGKISETFALVGKWKTWSKAWWQAGGGGGGEGGAGHYGYNQNILILIDNRKQTSPLGAETFASTKFQ